MDGLLNNDPDYQQKQVIISALKKMAKIQAAKNERWRVRAYTEAWKAIEEYVLPIKTAADAKMIPGIGSSISTKIGIIIDTGTHPMLDEYDATVKAVEDLCQVHGIGAVFANSLIFAGSFSSRGRTISLIINNTKQILGYQYAKKSHL